MMWRHQNGFTYVIVMFAVAIASIMALRATESALTNERRAREDDLIEVGTAFRNAIRDYYEGTPGTFKEYPTTLKDMLDDVRTSTRHRELRRLYPDPITGQYSWGLVYAEDAKHIIGVYSLSTKSPLKVGGFSTMFANFAGAKTYRDWQFKYVPNQP